MTEPTQGRTPPSGTDYGSNSHKARARAAAAPDDEPKVITPLELSAPAVMKKRGIGQKIKGIFFGGEFKNAARFVTADVLLPAIRKLFVDATTAGVERVVFGESQQRRRPGIYGGRISYNTPVNRGPVQRAYLPDQPPRSSGRTTARDTENVILTDRAEAESFVEAMETLFDRYQVVSLADMKQLLGHPHSPIDNKWGWLHLHPIEIRQIREGYLIDLPQVEEI